MTTELGEPSIVIDVNQVLPAELQQTAALRAIRERASNAPAQGGYALAVARARLWQPGRTLRVRFLGGSKAVQDKTLKAAQEWTQYANLVLEASDAENAELRVAFDPLGGCWSWVGTEALAIPVNEATINLSVLGGSAIPAAYRKYVLHEFGHALGCIHEHQTPIAGIRWNREQVYEDYCRWYGWPKRKVDNNVLFIFDQASTNHTKTFDPESIMVYPIPKEHTLDGYAVAWGDELSEMDKAFIAEVYPKG